MVHYVVLIVCNRSNTDRCAIETLFCNGCPCRYPFINFPGLCAMLSIRASNWVITCTFSNMILEPSSVRLPSHGVVRLQWSLMCCSAPTLSDWGTKFYLRHLIMIVVHIVSFIYSMIYFLFVQRDKQLNTLIVYYVYVYFAAVRNE